MSNPPYYWYLINIIRNSSSNIIFTGYFKVLNNNYGLIAEFYNSNDETTNIINIDGENNADYRFYNLNFTGYGVNILSIPNLDNEYNAVQWQLSINNGLRLAYKNINGTWNYLNEQFTYNISNVPFMPSNLSKLTISEIQNLSSNDLKTILNIITSTQFIEIINLLSENGIIKLAITILYKLTVTEIINIFLKSFSLEQFILLISTIINKLSIENISLFIKEIELILKEFIFSKILNFITNLDNVTLNKLIDGINYLINSTYANHYLRDLCNYLAMNGYNIIISNICFLAGTPVLTNQGKINIENINPNLHTIRNKKILCITKTVTLDKYLICFEKDSICKNIPSQKTIISKNHEIFYSGKMIKAKEFLNKSNNIYKIKYNGEILYNVLMENHDKMIVNNMICETLNPNNIIGKFYIELNKCPSHEKRKIITKYNRIAIEHYSKNTK